MNASRQALVSLKVFAVCAGILASAYLLAGDPSASASPLANEDIVRMVVAGTPEGTILESIRTRPEVFDVSDDMVAELRLAGVSEAVIAAMKQRHADSVPPPPPVERSRRGTATVVVTLNASGAGPKTLKVPAWADENAKARFHLPKENEQREVKDLAVFLACTAPEHIPDLWRSKTPLGRDMVSVSRHEMLAFVAGDTPAGKPPRLELPARIEAEVDASEPHDLLLGVAARIGDRWIQLAVGALQKVTIAKDSPSLVGRIEHPGRAFDFKIELTAPRRPAS
jgi:hypothetical protein